MATAGVCGSTAAEGAMRCGPAGWLAALCLVLGWCLTASPAWSQEAVYQGRVTDGSGIPQTGQVDLELRIFDFDTAGTLFYKELHRDVPLSDAGVFRVALGGGSDPFLSYDASLFAGGDPRYLEVLVDGELMTPRQRIGTVPTALVAEEWTREAALQSQVSLNDGRITVLELVPQGPHDRPGSANTSVGADALLSNTIGTRNSASGDAALSSNTTGSDNTASGHLALFDNISGSGNTALGSNAGELTTGDNNILIDNAGVAGESNTIRIGDSQSQTFVAGISNTAPAGPVQTVVVTPEGQLGIGTSPTPSTFVIGAHEFNEMRSHTKANGLAATWTQHDRCIRPNALTGGPSLLHAQLPASDPDVEPLFCIASANLSHLPHNATIAQLGCTLANATHLTTPLPPDVDDHASDTAVVALIRVDADANETSLAEVGNATSQEASPTTPCSGACQFDRSAASYHLKAILPVQDAFTQGALGAKLISCTITIQP